MTNPSPPCPNVSAWPFIRECQECGHKDVYRDITLYKGDSWKDVKCKKCKSDALDYGSKRPWTKEQIAEDDAYTAWESEHDQA